MAARSPSPAPTLQTWPTPWTSSARRANGHQRTHRRAAPARQPARRRSRTVRPGRSHPALPGLAGQGPAAAHRVHPPLGGRHITECPDAVLDGPPEADILRGGAADPELLTWFRAGHAALVQTLNAADPGLVCPTFMDAPSPLAFWARRQAHETAIHRADADSASGIQTDYDPEFAADGIDELITGFGQRRKYRPPAEHAGSMRVQATDTGHAWYVGAEDG